MLLQRGNSAAAATPEVATVIYCYLLLSTGRRQRGGSGRGNVLEITWS